ncbi:MAG: hypothetical protein DSY76_01185 [Bacteroidetes bacterium]|nr:MAG: hypothetical protein DSY76_01185 [Bacteroidota bacterium]
MKKVLIISYYWPPSGGAGVQRWLKFAKYLPEYGWEPIVLTVNPDFASYPQIDKSLLEEAKAISTFRTKTFELYNLYSSFKKNKQIPYGGFSNESDPSFFQKVTRFIRGNFFLPDARKGWNRFAFAKAKKLILKYDIDTIITTSPPHSTQLIGLKLKRELGVKWLADLRDPWTDIYYYYKFYPTVLARKIDSYYERKVLLNATNVTTVSPSIIRKLVSKYGSGLKVELLTNGYDESDFEDLSSHIDIKSKEILYTGTLTMDYPIDEVFSLVNLLKDYSFRFIGNVPENFKSKVFELGLENRVFIHEGILHSEIVKKMISASALLLLIPKIKDNEGILTGKLFEYLGSGRPIIAIGPKEGDVESILKNTGSGVYLEYDRLKTMVSAKELVIERKNTEVHKKYSRRNLTLLLSNILDGLE